MNIMKIYVNNKKKNFLKSSISFLPGSYHLLISQFLKKFILSFFSINFLELWGSSYKSRTSVWKGEWWYVGSIHWRGCQKSKKNADVFCERSLKKIVKIFGLAIFSKILFESSNKIHEINGPQIFNFYRNIVIKFQSQSWHGIFHIKIKSKSLSLLRIVTRAWLGQRGSCPFTQVQATYRYLLPRKFTHIIRIWAHELALLL